MAVRIADTAVVDPTVVLEDGVAIGPYCVVESGAVLGRNVRLIAHVCVIGKVKIGTGSVIGPFSIVGAGDSGGSVIIGDDSTVREGASIEQGRIQGEPTRIGSRVTLEPHVSIGPSVQIPDGGLIESGHRVVQESAADKLITASSLSNPEAA